MGRAGMTDDSHGYRRVVVEKPFGTDLKSAQALSAEFHKVLDEDQIYRIDHYLGKESVQNMMVFRFANGIFEPIWNRNYIDNVQISVLETVDVGHRAGYYDGVGVVRDMFQNHLLALLSLVAMEPPASFQAAALRNERAKVLSEMRQVTHERLRYDTVAANTLHTGKLRVSLRIRRPPHTQPCGVCRQLALARRTFLSAFGQSD